MKNLVLFAVLAVIATSCCCSSGRGCGYEERYCTTPVTNNPMITRDAGGSAIPGVAY